MESVEHKNVDNEKDAIYLWMNKYKKDPTMSAIICSSRDSIELVEYAKNNIDMILKYAKEIEFDKIYNLITLAKNIIKSKPNKMYIDYRDKDQVFPFCLG